MQFVVDRDVLLMVVESAFSFSSKRHVRNYLGRRRPLVDVARKAADGKAGQHQEYLHPATLLARIIQVLVFDS